MNELSISYHPVLEALGFAIFHSLWQSVLLFFPLQLLLLLSKNSTWRYRILYSSFTILFLIFITTFCMEWNATILLQQHQSIVTSSLIQQHITTVTHAETLNRQWWQEMTNMYQSPYFRQTLPVVSGCYVIGILILGLRMLLAVNRIKSIRKQVLPAPIALQDRFLALTQLIAIKRKVSLYLSDHIHVPLMVGYLKPIVIFPVALINQLDMQQTEAILIHELAHVKRMDYLFNLLQTVMEILMFFNPIVWWFSAIIRKEREHCCDDIAVKHTLHPVKYAKALLQLELTANELSTALAASGNNKKHSLLNRIKRIVDMKSTSKRSPQGLIALLTFLMFIIAAFCYYTAVAQEQTPEKHKQTAQDRTYTNDSPDPVADAPEPPIPIPAVPQPPSPEENDETANMQDMPNINGIIKKAMNEANVAMSQINWTEINKEIDKAGAASDQVDAKEIKRSIKEAQKEVANIDWNEISKSVNSTTGNALQAINWNEMGDHINVAMNELDQNMQSFKIDGKTTNALSRAQVDSIKMQTRLMVKRIKEQVKNQTNGDLALRKEVYRNVKVLQSESRENATEERREAMERAEEIRAEARERAEEAREEARERANEAREEARENRERTFNSSHNGDTEALLKKLEQDGLINRNEKFKVNYSNNTLTVNGQNVSPKAYQSYLPKGKKVSMSISGSKNKLAISQRE